MDIILFWHRGTTSLISVNHRWGMENNPGNFRLCQSFKIVNQDTTKVPQFIFSTLSPRLPQICHLFMSDGRKKHLCCEPSTETMKNPPLFLFSSTSNHLKADGPPETFTNHHNCQPWTALWTHSMTYYPNLPGLAPTYISSQVNSTILLQILSLMFSILLTTLGILVHTLNICKT